MTWREERHVTARLASDASNSGWGGTLLDGNSRVVQEVNDTWDQPTMSKPIHVKETIALSQTLHALANKLSNCRVDAIVDSRVLIECWQRQYSRSHDMLTALKELFWTTVKLNVALTLNYVPSKDNPADGPSRRLSPLDCSLSPRIWRIVQRAFGGPGGHTCDLMAHASNAQCDFQGHVLPYFAPIQTPTASAVNLFAQNLSAGHDSMFLRCYVFPPFPLIGPVLHFLREQRARCTIVVPDRYPRPYWWPILLADSVHRLCLAKKGDSDVLRRPTKEGHAEYGPVPWDLWAFKVRYG